MDENSTHARPVNCPSLSIVAHARRTQSDTELVLSLARITLEALQAAPEWLALPPTLAHALGLIAERAQTMTNDLDCLALPNTIAA